MHELDLPRRYRTIFVCGGFGLGSTREQDLEALRRLHDHLEPGGMLVLDNEVPYADAHAVAVLAEGEAARSCREPRREPGRSAASARTAPSTRSLPRILDLDPLAQQRDAGRCARSCGATASSSPRRSTA